MIAGPLRIAGLTILLKSREEREYFSERNRVGVRVFYVPCTPLRLVFRGWWKA